MSSMGGLSSMQKSAGNRSDFAGFCLLSLVFSLNFALLSMSGGCSSFGPEALSGTNIHSEHQDRIIARSDSRMNWYDAKAYCQQKGGSLPLINGAASLDIDQAGQIIESGTLRIDGFGNINTGKTLSDWSTPWPSSLPSGRYWTGTLHSGYPAIPWYVYDDDGKVGLYNAYQSSVGLVVCVR